MNPPPPRIRPPKLRRRQAPSGFDILLVLLASVAVLCVWIVLSNGLEGLLRPLLEGNEVSTQTRIIGFLGVYYLSLLPVIHVIVLRRRGLIWKDLGLRPAAPQWYRRAIWVALLTFALATVLSILVQRLVGRPLDNPQDAILAADGLSTGSFLAMLLVVAGLAPLVEELLFRGLVYAWIRCYLGILPAATISAALFASVHAIPSLIPSIFAMGVILALLYERSGSLWPAVIVHGCHNAITLVLHALTIE